MSNRGSEWRRWELHLHTPETKKEDRYKGQSVSEKWNGFYSTIATYIGDESDPLKSICAIAITDYLSIDNYIKVRDDHCLPESVKLIMPNVELRINPIAAKTPINIHCIFDPDIADELEDRFFSKLEFTYNDKQYSAIKSELIRLGREFLNDMNTPDSQAYIAGLNQYVISADTLSRLLKRILNSKKKQ